MSTEAARLDLIQIILSVEEDKIPAAKKALEIVFGLESENEEFNEYELNKIKIGLQQMRTGKTKTSEEVRFTARKVLKQ